MIIIIGWHVGWLACWTAASPDRALAGPWQSPVNHNDKTGSSSSSSSSSNTTTINNNNNDITNYDNSSNNNNPGSPGSPSRALAAAPMKVGEEQWKAQLQPVPE